MSAPVWSVWCELSCDQCARSSPGLWAQGDFVPREQLKINAEADGFTFLPNGDCYCKACTAGRKEQQP